jgi:hypothetical protein
MVTPKRALNTTKTFYCVIQGCFREPGDVKAHSIKLYTLFGGFDKAFLYFQSYMNDHVKECPGVNDTKLFCP